MAGYQNSGLSTGQVVVLHLYQKVTHSFYGPTLTDLDFLRFCGLTDKQILDIVLLARLKSMLGSTHSYHPGPGEQINTLMDQWIHRTMFQHAPNSSRIHTKA